jgi:3-deoxy-D-manno-octulosonate 8-phosphate phosphatase (KDO 8-P phosphatase)
LAKLFYSTNQPINLSTNQLIMPPEFKNITTFIFDTDGVLTDGTVLVLENGLQARRMSIKDGFALQLAVKCGYRVVVISGSSPSPVVDRLRKLGISEVHMSVEDKKAFITGYIEKNELKTGEVLYMGDDLPDLPAMSVAGLTACPADAAQEIKEIVQYISPVNGGVGCARDVIEKVLKLNGQWKYHPGVVSR